MAIRLTKKNSVIFAVVIVVLCGSLGYLVWRVNQPETTAPTESEAGEGPACNYGSECTSVRCRWPWVAYCNTESPDSPTDGKRGFCECRKPESQTINPCRTDDPISDDNCHPPTCPSGEKICCNWNEIDCDSKCGEGAHEIKTECRCSSCNNPYYLSVYCKVEPVASCGDGIVGNTEGEECDPPNKGCIPEKIIVVPEGDDSMVTAPGICTSECKCVPRSYCGDGKVDSGEECDPPNTKCYNYCDPPGSECAIKDGYGMCTNTCQCEFVIPSSCGNGKLDTGEECENGNPSGVKCQWSSCNTESCKCIQSIVGVSKSVSEKCVNVGTADPRAELTYTILVKDIGRGEVIETIEDVLDPKVVSKGLIPTDISHNGRYSNGKIIWEGIAIQFARNPDSTISVPFTYKLTIDKSNFGVYTNNVTLTTTKGNTFQASATINADCIVTAPQTGIFDSTLGRIAGGFGLIVLGGFVYSMPSRVFMFNRQSDERRRNKYRVRFESKIFKK
jgi:hypothetical protein